MHDRNSPHCNAYNVVMYIMKQRPVSGPISSRQFWQGHVFHCVSGPLPSCCNAAMLRTGFWGRALASFPMLSNLPQLESYRKKDGGWGVAQLA
jgi:hypothetical protein